MLSTTSTTFTTSLLLSVPSAGVGHAQMERDAVRLAVGSDGFLLGVRLRTGKHFGARLGSDWDRLLQHRLKYRRLCH